METGVKTEPTELDFAYLAGVIDSDGSISIGRLHQERLNPNYRGLLQLTWVKTPINEAAIKHLKTLFGGTFGSYRRGSGCPTEHKETVKWCLTGKSLRKALIGIQPYLLLKKEQAINVIKLMDIVLSFRGVKPRPTKASNALHLLYLSNKSLNHKNSGDRHEHFTRR